MEGSELHVKSILVAFTGVDALSSIIVGLSKLVVMLETSTVAEVVMLVQPAMSPNVCQRRSYGSKGYLLVSWNETEGVVRDSELESQRGMPVKSPVHWISGRPEVVAVESEWG
jgi:hypothetical protein